MANNLYKYATAFGTGGAVFHAAFMNKGKNVVTPVGTVPIFVLGGALSAGAALAADILNTFITPEISNNDRLKTVNGAAVDIGSSAGGYLLGAKIANPDLIEEAGGAVKLAAIGAGAHVASQYVYNNYVAPMVGDSNGYAADF